MPFAHTLVESPDQLAELLAPVLRGEVPRLAIDTETSEVRDDRFTPFGTDTRVCGFSLSWPGTDLYVPVRHKPYDWQRRPHLLTRDTQRRGEHWLRVLLEEEGVAPFYDAPGWQPGWLPGRDPNVEPGAAWELLQGALSVEGVSWYAHNWPFDSKVLLVEGLELPWERMPCTQALSVFTDERPLDAYDEVENRYVHGGHSLKHLGEQYLGIRPDAQALMEQAREALGKGASPMRDWSMIPLRTAMAPYGCMDTHLTLRLADECEGRKGYQDERVRELLARHMAERRIIVEDMERPGIPVDTELSSQRAGEKEAELRATLERLNELAGTAVPVEDPKRLAPFLYQQLGLPMAYAGADDTREATLKKVRGKLVARGIEPEGGLSIAKAAQLLDAIMDYRHTLKQLTAFYRPLAQHEGGVAHPVISPIRALTTRMAASAPAVHQMQKPKKSKDPVEARNLQVHSVRHLVKPPEGMVLGCWDFNSQEMRLSAHYTVAIPSAYDYRFTWGCTLLRRGDCKGKAPHQKEGGPRVTHVGYRPNTSERPQELRLVEGFMDEGVDFDPHQRMVELCEEYGLGIDRDRAKTAVYAILYGVGAQKLSDMLDCDFSVARRLIRLFWDEAYPELGRVRQFVDERLRRVGPATAWSHCDSIRSLHGGVIYLESGYKALNYLVQRSGREMLCKAIVDVKAHLLEAKAAGAYHMRLPIHDELIMLIDKESLDREVVASVSRIMVQAGEPSRVPMVVEPNLCTESWAIKEPLPADWGCDGVQLLKESS